MKNKGIIYIYIYIYICILFRAKSSQKGLSLFLLQSGIGAKICF